MKKIICAVMALALTISVLPLTRAGAAAFILKGDADGDGVVTVSDARAILRNSIGLDKVGYGTPEFARRKMTKDKPDTISVEDARLALRAAIGMPGYEAHYTRAELLELFNTVANKVKTGDFRAATTMSQAACVTQESDLKNYDFGDYNGLIKKMLAEDDSLVMEPTTTFTAASKGRGIYDWNYPATYKNYVSRLTDADVQSFTMYGNRTANVYASFPNTVNGNDLTALKAVNRGGLVMITVQTVKDRYTVNPEAPAMSRIYPVALDIIAQEYDMSEHTNDGLFDFAISAKCDEVTVWAKVDYYFTPDLTPVAAVYEITEDIDVTCRVVISAAGETAVNGTMSQACKSVSKTVYTFDEYFK